MVPARVEVSCHRLLTAATARRLEIEGNLRPIDPARDLKTIADLIGNAFADDLDDRGRATLREMRWLGRLSPLVWWLDQADPSFSESFNGFVWEVPAAGRRGQRIAGNVSLNRSPGNRQWWLICNVAVRAEHRGQGIGRRLVEAAIGEARTRRATGVLLQVYQDNHSALGLYTDLGFRQVAGEASLGLEGPRQGEPAPAPVAAEYRLHRWQPEDGPAVYELARLSVAPEQQWIRPLPAERYRSGRWTRLRQRLADLLADRQTYRLVGFHSQALMAWLALSLDFRRGDHLLEILVHPDHRGQIEDALISRALYLAASAPFRSVQATVATSHTVALDTLRDRGFRDQRTLLTLRKDF
jgi:ribosomal protein S18 acetylase RimI-like enzyme